ncbi:MAG: DUF2203 domain-containing protein [Limisphaerales bacterium]
MRFEKHYTPEQAREMLPQIRQWLKKLVELRAELDKSEENLSTLAGPGRDLGGDLVNRWVRVLAAIQDGLLEFYRRQIQVKDLDRGLIDFPAILAGKEVFLCWEQAEEDVQFWHDLDTGYTGRQRL